MQHLIWMCLESQKLDYPAFSYKWTMRAYLVPARQHSYLCSLDQRIVLLYWGRWSSLAEHAASEGMHMEQWGRERHNHLVSQIVQINPDNQWGDRCHSQITLTCSLYTTFTNQCCIMVIWGAGKGNFYFKLGGQGKHDLEGTTWVKAWSRWRS